MIYFQTNLERNFFYANIFRKNLDHTCKVVIYKYVFCWFLFRTKFDCNFVQSYVPCISYEIHL